MGDKSCTNVSHVPPAHHSALTPASFAFFLSLPAEIRSAIWQAALRPYGGRIINVYGSVIKEGHDCLVCPKDAPRQRCHFAYVQYGAFLDVPNYAVGDRDDPLDVVGLVCTSARREVLRRFPLKLRLYDPTCDPARDGHDAFYLEEARRDPSHTGGDTDDCEEPPCLRYRSVRLDPVTDFVCFAISKVSAKDRRTFFRVKSAFQGMLTDHPRRSDEQQERPSNPRREERRAQHAQEFFDVLRALRNVAFPAFMIRYQCKGECSDRRCANFCYQTVVPLLASMESVEHVYILMDDIPHGRTTADLQAVASDDSDDDPEDDAQARNRKRYKERLPGAIEGTQLRLSRLLAHAAQLPDDKLPFRASGRVVPEFGLWELDSN